MPRSSGCAPCRWTSAGITSRPRRHYGTGNGPSTSRPSGYGPERMRWPALVGWLGIRERRVSPLSPLANTLISAAAALVAGMCLATTGLLQQGAASKESADKQFSMQLIMDLVRDRTWLAGIGAAVASYAFQAVAL